MPSRKRNKPIVDLENEDVRKYLVEQGWKPPVKDPGNPWMHFDAEMKHGPPGSWHGIDYKYGGSVTGRTVGRTPIIDENPAAIGTEIHREIERMVEDRMTRDQEHRHQQLIDEVLRGRPIHTVDPRHITSDLIHAHDEFRRHEQMTHYAQPRVQVDPNPTVPLDTEHEG